MHLLYQELKCWAETVVFLVAMSLNSTVFLPTVDERTHFSPPTKLLHTVSEDLLGEELGETW